MPIGWCLAQTWHGCDAYSQIENQNITMEIEVPYLRVVRRWRWRRQAVAAMNSIGGCDDGSTGLWLCCIGIMDP